jgi:hypothetical protein
MLTCLVTLALVTMTSVLLLPAPQVDRKHDVLCSEFRAGNVAEVGGLILVQALQQAGQAKLAALWTM